MEGIPPEMMAALQQGMQQGGGQAPTAEDAAMQPGAPPTVVPQ
jgi:hypothetical protein